MKPLISVLVLASLFLAGTASAAAKTYYVSTNGLHEVNGVVWGTYTTSDRVDHDPYTHLQQAIRCLVTNNIAWYMGGGAYGGSAVNCLVSDNESFAQGGGFATTTPIVNTLVARNTATSQSGIYVADKATSVLVNTTVTANENTVADKSAVIRACITNCVVWGNTGTGTLQTSALSSPAYSCFPDADGSNGTTSSDPRLADVDGKTFVATSPRCRGDGLVLPWMLDANDVRSLDWYGAPRSYRDRADMGWVSVKPTYFILSVQ